MPGDTVRPLHIAYKLFLMATSEFGRHVESCPNQQATFWPIFMKLAIYDLRTKLNKCVKQFFQIPNRLAATANQT